MKKVISVILIAVLMLCMVTSCGSKALVGTWSRQYSVLGVVNEDKFVFNEDGTGELTTVLGIGLDMTYTAEDGVLNIVVDILGIETEIQYTYEFEKGDLLLTKDGETIVLEKQ